jgi:hypothetical protein
MKPPIETEDSSGSLRWAIGPSECLRLFGGFQHVPWIPRWSGRKDEKSPWFFD